MTIFGYFDQSDPVFPARDPGLDVECPVCHRTLSSPLITVSIALLGDRRSYFYRAHRDCYQGLSADGQTQIDSAIIDAVGNSRFSN